MNVTKEQFTQEILKRQKLNKLRKKLQQMEETDTCTTYISESYFRHIRRKAKNQNYK